LFEPSGFLAFGYYVGKSDCGGPSDLQRSRSPRGAPVSCTFMSTLSQDINSGLESHPESPIALPITFPGINSFFIPDMDHLSDDDDEPEESESTITMAKNIFWVRRSAHSIYLRG
jgi:hypothetical protein